MFSRYCKWALVSAAAFAATVVLLPASPSHAGGPYFMTGTFEVYNGFAKRRVIRGFAPAISSVPGSVSGMGAIAIPALAFSETGEPNIGAARVNQLCDPADPAALLCVLQNVEAIGFQPFPGFPLFAQAASTFTEANTVTSTLAPGGAPGDMGWCPQAGNPANGVGAVPACPGNALTVAGGVVSSLGGVAVQTAFAAGGGAPFMSFGWGIPQQTTSMGGPTAMATRTGVPGGIGLGQQFPVGAQGNVQYRNGNGFGGTMQIIRNTQATISFRIATAPTRFRHDKDQRIGPWGVGVPISHTAASTGTSGPTTQLPFTTTMGGNTINPGTGVAGPAQGGFGPFTSIKTRGAQGNPGGGPLVASGTTGFPWTTGQVIAQEDSCGLGLGGQPCPNTQQQFQMFMMTGTDARGPDGQGNLSLVSGGMFQNRSTLSTANYGTLDLTDRKSVV